MGNTWFYDWDRKIAFNMANSDTPENYNKFNDKSTNYLLFKGKNSQDELYIEEK